MTGTYTASYDGDSQLVYESSQQSSTTTSGYIVRSTALKGKIITWLDSSGNKAKTLVPADGMLAALQVAASGGLPAKVDWTHTDPLGISEAGTSISQESVYDPLGNYLPYQSVPTGPPPPTMPQYSPSYGGLGSGFGTQGNSGNSCTLDGTPANCNLVFHMINTGAVGGGVISSTGNPLAQLVLLC